MKLSVAGLHARLYLWPYQAVNIPYWPHRVLVIGRGRLTRKHTFNHWLPSAYRMHLGYCCRARITAWAATTNGEAHAISQP